MPPRPLTILIVFFWLATSGWMLYREFWPRITAGNPPPYHIGIADEVAGRTISWQVFQDDERIGNSDTEIRRLKGGRFALRNIVRFEKLTGLQILGIGFRKLSSTYIVNRVGQLRRMEAEILLDFKGYEGKITFDGNVKNNHLHSALTIPDISFLEIAILPKRFEIEPIKINGKGKILNILHPQHKIPGLWKGRRWKVPMFNPFETAAKSVLGGGGEIGLSKLIAEVHSDSITWDGILIPTWRIDVGEPGKDPQARIWVRRSDDWVLQYEARHEKKKILLKRRISD